MLLFRTILSFELKNILRTPVSYILLLLLLVISAWSVWCGNKIVRQKEADVAAISSAHEQHVKEAHQRFHTDTSTAEGKTLASQAGIPQIVEFRCPPVATLPPLRLAAMATGQLEQWPAATVISTKFDRLSDANIPFTNAALLAFGNFDFSYILVYIFPLILIIVTHNSYAQEMEQQTHRLLALQSGNIWRIVLCRLLVRFGLIWLLALIISIVAYLALNVQAVVQLSDLLLWVAVITVYLFCWLSICLLVIMLKKSSAISLLILLTCWGALTIIIPSVINSIVAVKAPVPLPAELASEQRECQEETWNMPLPPLLDSFYAANPSYAKDRMVSDTASYGNRRFIAYSDLLNRRMDRISAAFDLQQQKHYKLQQSMNLYNPVALMQQMLYTAASTNEAAGRHYQQETIQFRQEWLTCMRSYLMYDRMIPEEELDHLPVFKHQPIERKGRQLALSIIPLFVIILVAGLSSCFLFSDKTTY